MRLGPTRWRVIAARGAVALPVVVLLLLTTAQEALASGWKETPFPAGQTAVDVAQDSAGNVWATM